MALYLGAGFGTSVFLGLAFIFSASPFYDFYAHAPQLWGLSAVKDQNLGGILMNGEQTLVFLVALGYFLLRLLAEEEARERTLAAHQLGSADASGLPVPKEDRGR